MRTRKRNNFTLSEEAQRIVDKIPNYKKSRFVSEAIEAKGDFEKQTFTIHGTEFPVYEKGKFLKDNNITKKP